tara:strand:+ start:12300 stop:13010 length:711 start_codon:yes stop_codon:yes gene_type:complete
MPNWCENSMTVFGEVETLNKFAEAITSKERENVYEGTAYELKDNEISVTIFSNLLPAPENGSKKIINDKGELVGTAFADPERDGNDYINGWDWCIKNWGTKWGDCDNRMTKDYDDTRGRTPRLDFTYDTAWGPADYSQISEMYPELFFMVTYQEHGMGFMGCELFHAGEKVTEEYLDSDSNGDYPSFPDYEPDDDEAFDKALIEFDEMVLDASCNMEEIIMGYLKDNHDVNVLIPT